MGMTLGQKNKNLGSSFLYTATSLGSSRVAMAELQQTCVCFSLDIGWFDSCQVSSPMFQYGLLVISARTESWQEARHLQEREDFARLEMWSSMWLSRSVELLVPERRGGAKVDPGFWRCGEVEPVYDAKLNAKVEQTDAWIERVCII